MTKNVMPTPQASIATMRDKRTISRCSGEPVSPATCVRCAMRPNSVCMPVA